MSSCAYCLGKGASKGLPGQEDTSGDSTQPGRSMCSYIRKEKPVRIEGQGNGTYAGAGSIASGNGNVAPPGVT
ncbi:unnamed protein product [Pieris macdunnoughi]|uniref:Uncharacterized protein n=1 Tax=Pieris macdunnoughi TaxID=345717 RepID=A0A821RR42_9NEOP|nr:unnamed protein product [Pieris macdunnoughi]